MTALTVEQTLPGSTLGLISGLSDLLVIEIGGRRVLYALSRTENRLVELEIAPDGSLTVSGSLAVTGTFSAGRATSTGSGRINMNRNTAAPTALIPSRDRRYRKRRFLMMRPFLHQRPHFYKRGPLVEVQEGGFLLLSGRSSGR